MMKWPDAFKISKTPADESVKEEQTPAPVVDLSGYCRIHTPTLPQVVEEIIPGGPVLIVPKDYTKVAEIPHSWPRPPEIRILPQMHVHTKHEEVKKANGDVHMLSGAHRKDN